MLVVTVLVVFEGDLPLIHSTGAKVGRYQTKGRHRLAATDSNLIHKCALSTAKLAFKGEEIHAEHVEGC